MMSKCDIQIDFDNAERKFIFGDKITGTIKIQVNTKYSWRQRYTKR
ncbi:MAG: hypothetical protein ACMUJM_13695 [bacterium]